MTSIQSTKIENFLLYLSSNILRLIVRATFPAKIVETLTEVVLQVEFHYVLRVSGQCLFPLPLFPASNNGL